MVKDKFEYRKALRESFEEKKYRNSKYSLRSFARDLSVSPAALSQVLSGKRDFSSENLKKSFSQK